MRKIIGLFLFALCSVSLSFSQDKNQLLTHSDISYFQGQGDAHELQKLNLVLPESVEKPPLLIWIGGGAWSYVDRNMEMDLAEKIAQEGIAVASIGHRLSSAVWKDPKLNTGVKHPAHVEDLAMAVKWLYDHAEEYGYDRTQFMLGGFSSGAHLASLLVVDARYLNKWELDVAQIKGVIPISGAYDIADYHRVFNESANNKHLAEQHVQAVFGDTPQDFKEASPITYLDALKLPLLVISDQTVRNYTKLLEEEIKKRNIEEVEFVYVEELSHGELWKDMSYQASSKYRDMVIEFIKKVSEKNG